MMQNNSQRNLIVAMAAALAIGFLLPRPSFIDTALDTSSEVDNTHTDGAGELTRTTAAANVSSSGLVKVDFYGESLCPDCQHFVRDILAPAFDSGFADAFELRYIAAGNVRVSGRRGASEITCQHGEEECKYNRFINCAQKLVDNDQNKWFPYVKCLADNMRSMDAKAAGCAAKTGLEAADIDACARGEDGAALEAAAVEETLALEPEKQFVPWVVVNGVALGGAFEDLERYVCVATPPENRPEACSQVPDELIRMRVCSS